MTKCPFKKNKRYYLPDDDANIKFIEFTMGGYYLFKYVKHPEFYEYETRDGTEIWENKRKYLKESEK